MDRLFSLCISLLSATAVFSQKTISGTIQDSDSHLGIPHVYIENISRKIVVESDENGKFEIFSHTNDTLVFSSIGYYWEKYIVFKDNNIMVNLTPQIYELNTVLKRFPYSYDELTMRVLNMKATKDTLNLKLEHEPFQAVNNHEPGQLSYTMTGAITAIYNATNRHAQNAIKATELLSKKENILIANKKFNKEIVVAMTNVPDAYFEQFIASAYKTVLPENQPTPALELETPLAIPSIDLHQPEIVQRHQRTPQAFQLEVVVGLHVERDEHGGVLRGAVEAT